MLLHVTNEPLDRSHPESKDIVRHETILGKILFKWILTGIKVLTVSCVKEDFTYYCDVLSMGKFFYTVFCYGSPKP